MINIIVSVHTSIVQPNSSCRTISIDVTIKSSIIVKLLKEKLKIERIAEAEEVF